MKYAIESTVLIHFYRKSVDQKHINLVLGMSKDHSQLIQFVYRKSHFSINSI
jgi:hypothetical protein